jgi:hypothetical protein
LPRSELGANRLLGAITKLALSDAGERRSREGPASMTQGIPADSRRFRDSDHPGWSDSFGRVSRRARIVTSAVAGLLLIVGGVLGYGARHGFGRRPVTASGPPGTLPALSPRDLCQGAGSWGGDSFALFRVTVDPDPRSVTAVWWPTMNDTSCRAVITQGDSAQAGALARDVRAARPFPSGRLECPNMVGGAVDLYFAYGKQRWERVRVSPTGCAAVSAKGRKSLWIVIGSELAPLAPPGEWQKALR